MRLGPGKEFDLIRRINKRLGKLAVGIGDDAAVLGVPRGDQLVVSTDTAIEDVHFRSAWLTPREIAYRAVTAALSDLAAMAATPKGVLVSLALAPRDVTHIDQLADGIGDAVRAAKTVVLGGNVARADTLGITTTVLGSVFSPLSRAGARPGDCIYVTGSLGAPAAALRALLKRRKPEKGIRERFVHPHARIEEARWLAARGAVAAIDISDGLAADAGHLAAASGVAIEIASERVPVFAGATERDALAGGEEYELLVASRAPLPDAEFASRFKVPLTLIGRARQGSKVSIRKDGKRVATPSGHNHLVR